MNDQNELAAALAASAAAQLAQAQAMMAVAQALAESAEATNRLMDYVCQSEDVETDPEAGTYMSGKPR
ncbi:hypothetical protein [Stenotrophomonas sp. AS1]|uniref:hypothetical protein n=1 Tax=Stenotrophomonas sp. AS1 TaxID=3029188 RepID=UPI003B7BFED9